MPERRDAFDYTMLSTFMNCRRRYNYRINRGLVSKKPPTALTFGGAIHEALDSWYEDKNVDKAVTLFKESFEERLDDDNKRTHQMGEWILRNYHEQYQYQPWELVQSEMSFSLHFRDDKKFIGRIDKIIKWGDALWVVDHKTTSQLGSQFFKTAEPNLQFTGYVWAARQLGYNAVGVILDAILVAKGLLPGTSKNYKLTPLARFDVYRSDDHLKEWKDTAEGIMGDIEMCEATNKWYPNFDMCTYYGECPFRKVCKEDSDIRERIIEADYDVNHWSPLKEQGVQSGKG